MRPRRRSGKTRAPSRGDGSAQSSGPTPTPPGGCCAICVRFSRFCRKAPRRDCPRGAFGYNPIFFARVAQLVEQLTCNQLVEGSTPFSGTTFDPPPQAADFYIPPRLPCCFARFRAGGAGRRETRQNVAAAQLRAVFGRPVARRKIYALESKQPRIPFGTSGAGPRQVEAAPADRANARNQPAPGAANDGLFDQAKGFFRRICLRICNACPRRHGVADPRGSAAALQAPCLNSPRRRKRASLCPAPGAAGAF